jgi:sulfatase maturation enzyme AslB (radical SAM superfamily)
MDNNKFDSLKKNISPTFCMAKFHEATIWLYSSKIAGCHHTPLFPTGTTPLTFFNNTAKREQQSKMIAGEKPTECNYCWKLEDKGQVSDRELKSLHFKSSLLPANYLDTSYNFKPKALELAFSNTCNLACAYCSPSFSTEWINDIKNNGMYQNITNDIKMHYSRGVDNTVSVDMEMFWQWFDSISTELESVRITGGEPLLHEETFKTFEKVIKINPNIECVIHTNLCQKPLVIERFVSNIKKLNNVRINISNESAGETAEFIRDGMKYSEWLNNLEIICSNTTASVSISTTITALSLIGLDELYRDIIQIRKAINLKTLPYISINLATYPVFQSLACLSNEELIFYHLKFTNFFESIQRDLLDIEKKCIPRLISMLDSKLTNPNHKDYRRDSDNFFSQYTQRRSKKINFSELIGKK